MDNFNVPKRINRNVMKALGVLQGTHSMTAFVPAQSIIKQVELQMRRSKNMPNIEEYVLKSLCSLTHLGVLVRTGYSDYALRQALVFEDGTSAIPWRSSNTPVEVSVGHGPMFSYSYLELLPLEFQYKAGRSKGFA